MNRRTLLLGLLSAPLAKLGAPEAPSVPISIGAGKGHPDCRPDALPYMTSGYCQVVPEGCDKKWDVVKNIEFVPQTFESWTPTFTYTAL